jgi:hypothetical protein
MALHRKQFSDGIKVEPAPAELGVAYPQQNPTDRTCQNSAILIGDSLEVKSGRDAGPVYRTSHENAGNISKLDCVSINEIVAGSHKPISL